MAREKNFLLGRGEELTSSEQVDYKQDPKNAPYPFPYSRDRLIQSAVDAASWARGLPSDACPGNEVVAEVIVHPRYISKSDSAKNPLLQLGFRVVGRKQVMVKPERWGTKRDPGIAVSDKLFLAVDRKRLSSLPEVLGSMNAAQSRYLSLIEQLSPYTWQEKVKDVPDSGEYLAEVVLHNAGEARFQNAFFAFAEMHNFEVFQERMKVIGWLTFLPVRARVDRTQELAQYSFLRAIRRMPMLRTISSGRLRQSTTSPVLPDIDVASVDRKAVIFDGGIPASMRRKVSRWVRYVEPPGIGVAEADAEAHGLAVTSAFLFGPLENAAAVHRPPCLVDHVRVIDSNSFADEFGMYDVLTRITSYLRESEVPLEFANLSLGPDSAMVDDDVTAWTAELDLVAAQTGTVIAVAVGNDGELDAEAGLNRIQPPSDGVNVLSIGAATSQGKRWKRAPYSCVGPGRCPGVFKPDIVAFGGVAKEAFDVVGPSGGLDSVQGTSFAAPFALRAGAGVAALLPEINPLMARALLIHRSERSTRLPHAEVGWGRVVQDPTRLITCDDDEAVVVYQGKLPVGIHLRAGLALPPGELRGKVEITATLAIVPEVDPEHVSTYTRGGMSVIFRPDATEYPSDEDGKVANHPETCDFFSKGKLLGRVPEYLLRTDAKKWETVLKATRTFDGFKLNAPFMHIYFNHRERGRAQSDPRPISYALVVTVRAREEVDLYQRTLQAYADVLVPMRPLSIDLRV